MCATLYPPLRPDPDGKEAKISVEVALYQPDFAHNAGAVLRLCACLGVHMHIIHPTGFTFSRRALRHGGLDYVNETVFTEHDSFAAFESWRRAEGCRLVLLTTRAQVTVHESAFLPRDVIMLGRETAGVPDSVAEAAGLRVRIPMRPGLRSLNVATAASLVLGEALRQTGSFERLQ